MSSRIDLHTHTQYSDGTLSPQELVAKAVEHGVQVLSITDHDSTAGYQTLIHQGMPSEPLQLIPGIELSAEGESHCHLLGYYVDVEDTAFQAALSRHREWRHERVKAMVEKVNALGFAVELQRVLELAAGGSVGRPHIADALQEKGVVRNRKEAFDRFLKRDRPAYVAGQEPSARDCIQLIRHAGGIPVLAHPSFYDSMDFLKTLIDWGLLGLEAYYPEHSRALTARYLEIAKTHGLVATGGSDFHGPKTGRARLACVDVPPAVLENLQEARRHL